MQCYRTLVSQNGQFAIEKVTWPLKGDSQRYGQFGTEK
jgi:hypothetical protein